jgi:hypothetical protein
MNSGPVAIELAAEQSFGDHARECLRAMRRRAQKLQALGTDGGNAFATEALAFALQRRIERLLDDGTTPLFFGPLDYRAGRS